MSNYKLITVELSVIEIIALQQSLALLKNTLGKIDDESPTTFLLATKLSRAIRDAENAQWKEAMRNR